MQIDNMKGFICFVTFAFSFFLSRAQTTEWVKVMNEQTVKLNSTGRTQLGLGGTSKITIPIFLPENTVDAIYTIKTISGKETQTIGQGVDLMGKILSLSSGGTTLAASQVASKIFINSTGGQVNVYMLPNRNQATAYEMGNNISYAREYSRLNFLGGAVPFYPLSGQKSQTVYLAIENQSSINSTIVIVSAAARVKKEIKQNGWTKEMKDKVYAFVKEKVTTKEVIAANVSPAKLAACFMDELIQRYTPEQFTALATYEQDLLQEEILTKCLKSFGVE